MLGSDDTTKTPTVEGQTESATPPPAAATPPPQPPPQSAPAWSPPRRERDRDGALIGGAIILLIGLWFFATTTLGLELPLIDWGQYWPVILIAIGLLIVLRAIRRSA